MRWNRVYVFPVIAVAWAFFFLLPAQSIRLFHSSQAYLGIEIRDVDANEVSRLGLPTEAGVYVERVEEDSPADMAGLRAEDIILEYSRIPVLSVSHFKRLISDTPPGRRLSLKVWREGSSLDLTVEIGSRRSGASSWMPRIPEVGVDRVEEFVFKGKELPGSHADFYFFSRRPTLGITAGTLTAQMADFLRVPGPDAKGVLVMEVLPDSPAEDAGLQAGDVILSAEGESVTTPAELSRLLPDEDDVVLQVAREGRVLELRVHPRTRHPKTEESQRL